MAVNKTIFLLSTALLAVLSHYAVADTLRTVVVNPNQTIKVEYPQGYAVGEHEHINVNNQDDEHLYFNAPMTPDLYRLELQNDQGTKHTIQVAVKVPFTATSKKIEGYEIGSYPSPYKGLEQYQAPDGFIRVMQSDLDTYITKNVQIKQLLCKQTSGYPKFLYVNDDGLTMLEDLLQFLKGEGVNVTRFAFISAYRTPFYNRSIGNGRHSRHQYGDAFDLYIDENGNKRMDDLNGDGKEDARDVDTLYALFEKFHKQSRYIGGIGRYYPKSHHGGFVHIDNRGFKARW
ncbi:D-Ala-D-Ala carboxypeptidase family metallohydrolase [Pseudoalteromonas pernae]|uniref:D-Ala-D-Ala carboxypeptidase family metallohydrolase n=1 Tax=Pseudoalteromonas pernae TaxID=3118054 RepID=UPI0032429487